VEQRFHPRFVIDPGDAMLDYDLILDAMERLDKRVRFTETIHSHHFSERLGFPLLFKCENLQRTGAFKLRGALNVMTALDRRDLSRGVITASAGNHAQGVAYGADLLGIRSTVFMPETTPLQMALATKVYGAEVVLTGKSFDDACAAAIREASTLGARFIHPFDDEMVMAGQGTIGLDELLLLGQAQPAAEHPAGRVLEALAREVEARAALGRAGRPRGAGAARAAESEEVEHEQEQ
jgi:threonine dehydratase